MKLSYNWLTQYLNIELTVKQICELLTDNGLEIEWYREINFINKILERIILGKICFFYPHPYNINLNIILVNIGNNHIIQVICNYKNIFKGKKVIIAPIGGYILNRKGIKKIIKILNINGIFSYGILCMSKDIGMEDSNLLFIYNNKLPGTLGNNFFKIKKDYCFEVEITPNRIDTMSHWGIARNLYTILKARRYTVLLYKPSIKKFQTKGTLNKVLISIDDIKICKRYSGCIISEIKIAPSNRWIQNRLLCIGLQPYNNLIDIVNLVMYEFGQPINVLDIDDIDGKEMHIKKLEQNIILNNIENLNLKIKSKDLMIYDTQKPIGFAGIFSSNVQGTTKSIFLESAYFEPINIQKNIKKYGINTFSSFLFQRGVDQAQIIYVLKRAAILLHEITGGNIHAPIDIYPQYVQNFKTIIRYKKIYTLIGKKISKQSIKKILSLLEIDILIEKKHELNVSIPSYRRDVFREVDLIEDILRIYDIKNIKIPKTFYYSNNISKKNTFQVFENDISILLNAQGFYEVINISLTKKEYINFLKTTIFSSSTVKLINTFNKEISVMRESLLFGLLENISYNIKRKNSKLKFFEWGKIYEKLKKTYNEKYYLGLIISGKENKDHWIYINGMFSFFYFKGVIEGILNKYGISNLQQKIKEDVLLEHALWLYNNNVPIARLGRVKNKIIEFFNIRQDVFYAEISCTSFFKIIQDISIYFEPISQLPGIHRDVSILLNKYISFEEIYQNIKSTREEIIKNIKLFDIYEGDNLQKNTKSYALSFYLENRDRNLSDIEIRKTMENIQKTLIHNLGVHLR